jgi:hypothetical protein
LEGKAKRFGSTALDATGKIGASGVIVSIGTPCRYNLPNRKKKLRQNLKKTARRR